MNAIIRNASRTLLLAGGITLAATAVNAQMKIGDNPSQIKKSAILDLESTKQGLLLPRLTSFTDINAAIGTDPVDGMIVYLNGTVPADRGVYMRRAGAWVKIASADDASVNWSKLGNAGTTAADYIGTSDAQPLSIRTGGVEALNISAAGVTSLPRVVDLANPALLEVVVISSTGAISKRTLPASAFRSLYNNIHTAANSTFTNLNISENTTTGEITFNAPVLSATSPAATEYGFLTKSDWDKLQALTTGNNFTVANFITAVAAGDENKGGHVSYDAPTATYTLELVAASATLAGIVTTTTQTFGGAKTFAANVTANQDLSVVGAATVGATLGVTGATTLNGATTVNNTLGVTGATTLGGATTINNTLNVTGATTVGSTLGVTGKVTLGTTDAAATAASYDVLVKNATTNEIERKPFNLDALTNAVQFITTGGGTASTSGESVEFTAGTIGTDVNIVADGTAKTVTVNVPNASAADPANLVRGVVSTGDQSFAGNKSFGSSVAVGSTAVANSTLQVNGSLSMAITTVATTGYTISNTDNTILVNTSSASVTVTLPAPDPAITGRIYTIKKIGNGGIDNVLTIACTGSIEGGVAGDGYRIYNDYTYVTLQTDGAAWYIIKK